VFAALAFELDQVTDECAAVFLLVAETGSITQARFRSRLIFLIFSLFTAQYTSERRRLDSQSSGRSKNLEGTAQSVPVSSAGHQFDAELKTDEFWPKSDQVIARDRQKIIRPNLS
jgi:hypothetical protein